MRTLSLDPGKTTGFAYLENRSPIKIGEVKNSYQVLGDWLIGFLNANEVDILIIEDFVFRPGFKENQWKTTEVPKLIGQCQQIARERRLQIVIQQPSIKPVGYGQAGLKYVKGKRGMHREDAVAHGTFYWFKTGRHIKG